MTARFAVRCRVVHLLARLVLSDPGDLSGSAAERSLRVLARRQREADRATACSPPISHRRVRTEIRAGPSRRSDSRRGCKCRRWPRAHRSGTQRGDRHARGDDRLHMSRIASSRPPGVSISRTTSSTPASCARSMAATDEIRRRRTDRPRPQHMDRPWTPALAVNATARSGAHSAIVVIQRASFTQGTSPDISAACQRRQRAGTTDQAVTPRAGPLERDCAD